MSERYVLSDNGFVADMGYTLNGEGEEVMADEIVKRLNALEAKLKAIGQAVISEEPWGHEFEIARRCLVCGWVDRAGPQHAPGCVFAAAQEQKDE